MQSRKVSSNWIGGLKFSAGLFTLPSGKVLSFPSSEIALIERPVVQDGSSRLFLRRCIDGKAPNDIDPRGNLGVNGSGWKCRGVSQEELPARGSRGLCGTDSTCDAGLPSASPVRANGGVLRAQGQVLQDHLAQALPAQILSQEDLLPASSRRGLRNAGLLRCPRGFATGVDATLTLFPTTTLTCRLLTFGCVTPARS